MFSLRPQKNWISHFQGGFTLVQAFNQNLPKEGCDYTALKDNQSIITNPFSKGSVFGLRYFPCYYNVAPLTQRQYLQFLTT